MQIKMQIVSRGQDRGDKNMKGKNFVNLSNNFLLS